jgi:gliding motility-associated-like protein
LISQITTMIYTVKINYNVFTFHKKAIFGFLMQLFFLFALVESTKAQCPTVTNINQSFCDIESPTISSLQAINNGGGVAWFATATSTTPLAPGAGLVNGQSYFADNSTGDCGTRIQVFVTVFSAPIGQNFQGVCVDDPNDATIANLIVIGNNIQWYNVPSGGVALPTTTVLIPNTIYYASQTNPNTGCETSRRSVFVSVGVVPLPVGNSTQFFCNNPLNPPTVGDLVVSGNNNWYATSTSALPLPLNTPLVDGQSYYATTVDPPCESIDRLEVTVVIEQLNNAGNSGNYQICDSEIPNANLINLFDYLGGSPLQNGSWSGPFTTSNGYLGTLDTSQLSLIASPFVFTYTETTSVSCVPATATVTVTVNPISNAGTDGSIDLCTTSTSIDLFTLLGNNPDTGGTWSPALASGTGLFNPAVDAGGVYTYTVPGIAPCPNATANVTVALNPQPIAGTNGTANLCNTSPSVDLITFLGGTPQTGGTWSPALASGTGIFNPAVDPAGVYTYTVIGTPPCENETATVTVTINPEPNAGTDGSVDLCVTSTPVDLFTLLGNNPDTNGTWSPALASGTGLFNPAVDTGGVYTYTVPGIAPCPNATANVIVALNPQPIAGTSGTANLCNTSPSVDLITFLGGTPQTGGTWSPALASGTGIFNPAVDPAGVYTYTVIGTPPCENETATVTVTINPEPNAGTDGSVDLCVTSTPVDLFTLLGNNPDTNGTWSPALASGTGLFNPAVDPAGVYTYTVTGIAPCPNATANVTVALNPQPIAGTNGTANLCNTSPSVDLFTFLGGTPQTGGTWSPALASGTGIFNPAVDPAGVYTYTVIGTPPCENETATVTVTINPEPNAGTDGSVDLCVTSTPVDLFTLLGNNPDTNGTWSPALASGTGLFNPAVDPAGVYTYTVLGIAPCPNATANVTVALNPQPIAGTSGTANLCATSPSVDLFTYLGGSPQTGGTWSPALASGTGIFNPAVDPAGVYTYTVDGTPPCENETATVTVILSPEPNAGTDGSVDLCVTSTPVDLFTLLGNNPDTNGTWSPALASGTGVFNPAVDLAGVYTYTVPGIAPCPNATANVTVALNPQPIAGTSGTANLCDTSPSVDLFTYLGGSPQTGGTWSPALASGTGIFNPAVDPAGVYTYTVVGTPPCENETATVTVILSPEPNAGTDGSVDLCVTSTPVDLFTLLGNNPDTGGTWSPALASGTGVFNPAVDPAGVYTYTVTGIAPCPNATANVTVALNPQPIAGTSGTANLCNTSPSVDLFTYLGGTPQTGGTWSPALASGTGIFNPAVDPAGVYTYTVIGTPPCENETATVTVILSPEPNAGTDGSVDLCVTSTPVDLFTLLGNNPDTNGTWSPALASGTGVFNPAIDPAGVYTYTVLGIAPCPNATANVTVALNPQPIAGTNGTANLCATSPAVDLFTYLGGSPQTGGTWSPALASGTGIFNSAVDPAGVYTYTVVGTPPCENETATVTVILSPEPNAGTDGSVDLCVTSTPVDLFTLLGNNPDTNGTWSPALASGTGLFNPAVDPAGVYTYTVTGIVPCPNATANVTVALNPQPIAGTSGTANLCTTSPSVDLFTYLNGSPQTGGTWSPALDSGTGIFNPAVDPAGVYTYTVVGTPPCENETATVTVILSPEPNAGTDGSVDLCVTSTPVDLFTLLGNNPDTGGTWSPALASGTGVFNPAVDPAGVYTYTVTGIAPCPNATATVTISNSQAPNAGLFSGAQDVCSSNAAFDLFTLLDGTQQSGGVWTALDTSVVSNIFNATINPLGTYTFTYTVTNACGADDETVQFTIIQSPQLTVDDIDFTSPICQDLPLVLTLFNLSNGTYQLSYILSGANTSVETFVAFTVTDGEATLEIPATSIPNAGITQLTVVSIQNTATTCTTLLSDVVLTFEILPKPEIENANIVVADSCIGSDVVVQITGAVNLPNGDYEFLYNIPNAIPNIGTSGTVTITDGAGQFVIPAANIPNPGVYAILIYNIVSQVNSCTNLSEDATVSFEVFPLPSVVDANVAIGYACLSNGGLVNITNATNLSDGDYSLTYSLSGAVTLSNTITVSFVAGNASFTLPTNEVTSAGDYVLTITTINSNTATICGLSGNSFPPVAFTVTSVPTPELIEGGNAFCEDQNPTVFSLTSNVIGVEPIVWYDQPINGTALDNSTPLSNGATYYGAVVATSGCESDVRLVVTVQITDCSDIIIPDGFSPNGDGINDFFVIKNIRTLYPNFSIEFYNRYGTVLYKGNNSKPDWDGFAESGLQLAGSKVPVGVYFFILNFNDGLRKPIQGRLYLSR